LFLFLQPVTIRSHIYLITLDKAVISIKLTASGEVASRADGANMLDDDHETRFLRVATSMDRAFLRMVFVSTRVDEFASSGMSGPQSPPCSPSSSNCRAHITGGIIRAPVSTW